MKIRQMRRIVLEWMLEQAVRMSEFLAAYTAVSTNWLSDEADLSVASDLDIMVVGDRNPARAREKFLHRDVLLEISCLHSCCFHSPEQVLGDYHLAPSFRTTRILSTHPTNSPRSMQRFLATTPA